LYALQSWPGELCIYNKIIKSLITRAQAFFGTPCAANYKLVILILYLIVDLPVEIKEKKRLLLSKVKLN
jgi:hypothetical protein